MRSKRIHFLCYATMMIVFPMTLLADALAAPRVMIIASPSGDSIARIVPGSKGTVNQAAKNAECIVLKYDHRSDQYLPAAHWVLRNEVLPSLAALPDDGSYLVTVDNYFDNENSVVLYGADGRVVKSWKLADLFTEDELAKFEMFSLQVAWHGGISVEGHNQQRVLISAANLSSPAFELDTATKSLVKISAPNAATKAP